MSEPIWNIARYTKLSVHVQALYLADRDRCIDRRDEEPKSRSNAQLEIKLIDSGASMAFSIQNSPCCMF